jgi:hypothetical protein
MEVDMSEMERVDERLRAALNEIEDLSDVGEGIIAIRWTFSAYELSDGQVKTHSLIGRDYCSTRRLLDVAGYGTTRDDGRAELSLNYFHCLARAPQAGENVLGYQQPINVVATPRGGTPALLAVGAQVDSSTLPQDVKISVAAWDTGGAPAPGIPFNWRCLVPIIEIVG